MKINQTGRSMVEMIGVLAIIGVLIISGIYGYRQMIIQNKANNLWQDVMLWATVIRGIPEYRSGSDKVSGKVQFSGLEKAGKSGYQIEAEINHQKSKGHKDGVFFVRVADVPQDVCEKVIQMRPNQVVGIQPNGWRSSICETGKNKMLFTFDIPDNPCASLCQKEYENWQKNCGTSWKDCDPKMGFWCHWRWGEGECPSGDSSFVCAGFRNICWWGFFGADNHVCF